MIFTIDSGKLILRVGNGGFSYVISWIDDEIAPEVDEDEEKFDVVAPTGGKQKKGKKKKEDPAFSFEFDTGDVSNSCM